MQLKFCLKTLSFGSFVTLRWGYDMKQTKKNQCVPCFLCGNQLDVRETFRGKPYLVCEGCGVQIFIRREEGITLLQGLIKAVSGKPRREGEGFFGNPQVLALLNGMEQFREKRRELESKLEFFDSEGANKEIHIAKMALDREIDRVIERLKGF